MANSPLQRDCETLEQILHENGFKHLFVKKNSNHLIVYSKDEYDSINRARLTYSRQMQIYQLSMADHTGRWEPTPYTGEVVQLATLLTGDFSFHLIDFDTFI